MRIELFSLILIGRGGNFLEWGLFCMKCQDVPVSGSCQSCRILLRVKHPVWTASSVACRVMPGVLCHSAVSTVSAGKVMIKWYHLGGSGVDCCGTASTVSVVSAFKAVSAVSCRPCQLCQLRSCCGWTPVLRVVYGYVCRFSAVSCATVDFLNKDRCKDIHYTACNLRYIN